MDLTFIDNAIEMSKKDQHDTEIAQLVDIARHIGSFEWKYDGDDKLHDGPIAQALLLCPGLKDAVHKNEDGTLYIDTNFIALATLGYVAAICRKVSGIPLEPIEQTLAEGNEIKAQMPTTPLTNEDIGVSNEQSIN